MSSGGMKRVPEHWNSQPATTPGRGPSNKVWRVIHACEYARDVLPVVEGQLAAGMRPYLVTPQGEGSAELYLAGRPHEQPRPLSLLRMWQDVRHWRKSILDCDPENSADLVHAHAFAAGMAAVRGVSCVVYDLEACIEDLAISSHQVETGSWMGRSFRVAEQFVLSRAAAVIVHSTGMKAAALERGTPVNNIFLIPDPLPLENEEEIFPEAEGFLEHRFGFAPESLAVYVPELGGNAATELPPAAETIFQGFSLAARELPSLRLFVHVPEALAGLTRNLAEQLKIVDRLCLVQQTDDDRMMRAAHIIVAAGRVPIDPVLARKSNPVCVRALSHGKALLAADLPRNRDATPEGRGCLWFEPGNPGDLGHRMAFLGQNAEFRLSMAAAGHTFITETRNGAAIGLRYAEVYRHAASRRKFTGTGPGVAPLQPAANWG